ncbi:hypothetical protein RYX36_018012 [Vicia faba]
MSPSGVSIEIPISGIFHENSIFAYFNDPQYIRQSSRITKYTTIGIHSIFQKEDFSEYQGIEEVNPKYQIQVDKKKFIPEEVHILPESSSLMVRDNSLVGIGTPITFNIRSRVGGLVRLEKKKIELKIFSGNIHFPGEMDKISRHSVILRPPRTEKDNLELKVVNYILYGNGKSIRGISDTRIQLVRTCLVFNWDHGKKSSSIEEAPTSFIEIVLVKPLMMLGKVNGG